MKHNKGFTLIELMMVVAIVGILAAIAYPSYSNSLIKGSRAAAKSYLLEVAQKQQQFLLDNRTYFDAATAAEFTAVGLTIPKEVSNFYTVATDGAAGPPPSFTATATPIGGKRQKDDGWLEVNNSGSKTSEKPDKW